MNDFIARTLIDHVAQVTEPAGFRGSGLPICPRRAALTRLRGPAHVARTFAARYNGAVGHAIHRLVQETWAGQGLLWGDWRCTDLECGTTFRETRTEGRCLRCGAPLLYLEVEVEDPGCGFAGHCNGVVWSDEHNGYLVVELNTRNESVIQRYQEPYWSDQLQAAAYATLLARRYWLPIAGRLVVWIGKPRPKVFKTWFYPGLGEPLYDGQVQAKLESDRRLEAGDLAGLQATCKVEADARGCPFVGLCFSPRRDQLLAEEYQRYEQSLRAAGGQTTG